MLTGNTDHSGIRRCLPVGLYLMLRDKPFRGNSEPGWEHAEGLEMTGAVEAKHANQN